MIVIEIKGAETQFADRIELVDDTKLVVTAQEKNGTRTFRDTYPLVNVIKYREIPDKEQES